jgi:hypothetical protein
MATGEAALEHQVDLNIGRGLTLDEFFAGKPGVYAGYAPAGDSNNPSGYSATVAGWLGIPENAPLASVGADSTGFPVDTSSVSDPFASSDGSTSSLSTGALLALGLAAAGVLWAVAS